MNKRQKREYVLNAYAGDIRASPISGTIWLLARKHAALTALAAIDAGKRWRDVLKEFER